MIPLIAALAIAATAPAADNGLIVVAVRTINGNYETFAGSRIGVSSILRRMPGEIWLPVEGGWRETGLTVSEGRTAIYAGEGGLMTNLVKVPRYEASPGLKANILSVTADQASLEFVDPTQGGLGSSNFGEARNFCTVAWPTKTIEERIWDVAVPKEAQAAISADVSEQIKNARGHRISPDGWDVVDWAWVRSQGRWQYLMRVSGTQRSASGLLHLYSDDYLSEADRREADRLFSSAKGQHGESVVDVYADDDAELAVILTRDKIYLHDYQRGSIGRMLKSTMLPGLQIVAAAGLKGDEARARAEDAAKVSPVKIAES